MCSEWTLLLWTGMSSRAVREKRGGRRVERGEGGGRQRDMDQG